MKINSDSILMFGKYEGKGVSEVLELDPAYFIWVDDETDHIISNTLYRAALQEIMDIDYYECPYDIY